MFRSNILLVIGLLLLLGSCRSGENSRADTEKMLQAPPYAGVTDSIRQFPDSAGLYARRALMLSQHDEHELASFDYKKAWELSPSVQMAQQYVSNLMLVNKPEAAIDLLKECIAKYPEDQGLRRRLSEIYAQTGERQLALQQYDKMIARDSMNFEAWYEKALILNRLKDTAGAIAALETAYRIQPITYTGLTLASLYAASLDPKLFALCEELTARDTMGIMADIHYLKGYYYAYSKQPEKAIDEFNACIRSDWQFVDAYIEKGIVIFEQGKYDEALEIFRLAVTVSNINPDAWYWMGRSYEMTGKKQLALINYERALTLDPNYTEAEERIKRLKG